MNDIITKYNTHSPGVNKLDRPSLELQVVQKIMFLYFAFLYLLVCCGCA